MIKFMSGQYLYRLHIIMSPLIAGHLGGQSGHWYIEWKSGLNIEPRRTLLCLNVTLAPPRSLFLFPVARNSSSAWRTAPISLVGSRKFPNSNIFFSLPTAKNKSSEMFEEILSLCQGNMPYFLSVLVEKYLDLWFW